MGTNNSTGIVLTSMVFSVIITHQIDATVSHCHGDTESFFQCEAKTLIGKRLEDAGLAFYNREKDLLAEENLPVNIILRTKEPFSGGELGIATNSAGVILWTYVTGYPQLNSAGEIEQIITTYSATETDPRQQENPKKAFSLEDDWGRTFDALHDVITILSPDLRVLKANKAAYSAFRLKEGELIGNHCYEIFHGKKDPCKLCPAWRHDREHGAGRGIIYNERVQRSFEVRSYPILDDEGNLDLFVHSARDVTEELKTEEERNILTAAMEHTSDSVVITDVDGIIRYVNPSCCTTTGYSREELLGRDVGSLAHTAQDRQQHELITKRLKEGASWKGRVQNTKKDGSLFEENATISPIIDESGKITDIVAVKRDITREEQLQRQLQQAMKMEAIGTLAGGIAHDFNNILAAIVGYGQIARGKLAQDDPLRDDIDQILLAGDRAARLVQQILTFSRRDTDGLFHPLKVQHIIKEVVKLLRSSFPSTIDFRLNIDDNCPAILAEPTQIHQVLMNLGTNAKQAIGGNYGMISISLQKYVVTRPQLIQGTSLLTKGTYALLSIMDNGPGMDDKTKARIFDPFFTTKTKEQGTGLGLSVVHGIVDRHGGTIKVDSKPEVGTAFHIYFPVLGTDVEAMKESTEALPRGTERIMVVDDEKPIADLIKLMLTGLGYTVTAYSNSLAAVADFRKNSFKYDAIITDMTMPDMTGAELAREMLSLRPELPIILVTGFSEVIDEEKATRIGIRSFLLKPVKKTKLAQTLRTVLNNG